MWRITKHHTIGLKVFAIILIFAVTIAYAYLRGTLVVRGMSVTLDTLENGMIYTEPTMEVKGMTKRVSTLYINGRQIFLSPDGSFTDVIAPLSGYNVLSVSALSRLGREKILTYGFTYNPPIQTSLSTSGGDTM